MKKRTPKHISATARTRVFLSNKKNILHKRTSSIVTTHPTLSFLALLLLLLMLIVGGSYSRRPQVVAEKSTPLPKHVNTFNLGDAPRVSVQGQVEKTGYVTVVAQTGGIITDISVEEGETVWRGGGPLVSISSNYLGANAASLQRQSAAVSHQFNKDTYDTQKEVIEKQAELAGKSDEQSDELRSISAKSIGETEDLISLNEDILSTINENIKSLEAANAGGVNDAAILAAKQSKSSYVAATNAARSSLRSVQYTSSDEQEPAQSANISREIALKQLDVQRKSLDLNRDISALQLQIATITESLHYPVSPCNGVVERVHVKLNDTVKPGDVLMTILADKQSLKVVALISESMARQASGYTPSTLHTNTGAVDLRPQHVSSEPTDGALYSVTYMLPQGYEDVLSHRERIQIDLPIAQAHTAGSSTPFIPVDAVHQTQTESFIFVSKDGKAQARSVELGPVSGRYVEVVSGLKSNDRIILSRNIIAGEAVKADK